MTLALRRRRPQRRSDIDARGRLVLRPFFSYFGSKWSLGLHYPAPLYDTIHEPFAGGAGYALRHFRHKVILWETNPNVAALWRWLIAVSPAEVMAIPAAAQHVDELGAICEEARILVSFWFQRCTAGATRRQLSAWGRTGLYPQSFWGEAIRMRIARQVEHIRHWKVIEADYREAENDEVTRFVDPPYIVAGKQYRSKPIDYAQLAAWCRARRGQLIACEQVGADWLPFRPFRLAPSNSSQGAGRTTHEAIYTQGCEPLLSRGVA